MVSDDRSTSPLTCDHGAVPPVALNVKQVASLLGVSVRHVYRMTDGGLMPRPLKLGHVNRWRKTEIDGWLAGGAKPVKN